MKNPLLRTFLYSFLLTCSLRASATSYYLSAAGSDQHNGLTPATAWQTLAHLNDQIPGMQPGDEILLRRGDTFRGSLELFISGGNGSPVRVGAYGTGPLPVISGAIPVTGWVLHSGNVYRAAMPRAVKMLFADNTRMTLARYPNTGWLFTDVGFGVNGFRDAGITQPSGYWNGGQVHLRTVDWQYEIRTVQSQVNGDIVFQNPTDYGVAANWGYFLSNKLAALDAPGEWYYDAGTSQLYFYAPGGVHPATLSVEAIVEEAGVDLGNNASYLAVKDLRIEKFARNGIRLAGVSDGVSVSDCEIRWTGETGIHLDTYPAKDLLISGNTITDAEGRGIYLYGGKQAEISGNVLKRIGMVPGYGLNVVNNGVGILCYEGTENSLITANHTDSTGNAGIRVDGSYNTIEYNRIHHAMLTLSDGGGFHCYGVNTHHNVIRNNWVKNVVGNVESSPHSPFGMGIYIDNFSTYITVSDNIISGARNFGLINNFDTHHNTFTGNLSYGNGEGGLMMDDKANAVNTGNVVSGNVFFCLGPNQIPMRLIAEYAAPNWGTFANNAYHNPYSCVAVETKYDYGAGFEWRYYGLAHWQSASGQDAGSTQSIVQWNESEPTDTLSADLLSNGTFDTHLNGWGNWPGNNTMTWTNAAGLDAGAMQLLMTSTIPQPSGLAHSPGFAFAAGNWYQLSMSTRGINHGAMRLNARETVGFTNTPFSRNSVLVSGVRKDLRITFQMPTAYPQARMDFEVDFATGGFYLDNVHLYRIAAAYIEPGNRARLFVNHAATPRSITFQDSSFTDLQGNPVATLALDPWSAVVLLLADTSINSLLPIALGYFEASCTEEGMPLLKWGLGGSGADERLLVERSENGQDWEIRVSLDASVAPHVEWVDPAPLASPAYYRLRVEDANGQSQLSPTTLATCSGRTKNRIQVFPHPIRRHETLRITAPEGADIRLATLSGQEIGKWNDAHTAAESLQSHPPRAGLYLLYSPGLVPVKLVVYE